MSRRQWRLSSLARPRKKRLPPSLRAAWTQKGGRLHAGTRPGRASGSFEQALARGVRSHEGVVALAGLVLGAGELGLRGLALLLGLAQLRVGLAVVVKGRAVLVHL